MKKIIITLLIIKMSLIKGFSQDLIPIYKLQKSEKDSFSGKLFCPNLNNFELDKNNSLYYKSHLIFKPEKEFEYSIYEVFKCKYIVITAISENLKHSSLLYKLPKNELIIIDLDDSFSEYRYKLKDSYIIGIKKSDLGIDLFFTENLEKVSIEKNNRN